MSRQLDAFVEEKSKKRRLKLGSLLDGGLEYALNRAGAELVGLTVKFGDYDCLLVVKVVLAGRRQVAFIGSSDLPTCLLKLEDLALRDVVGWRVDVWEESTIDGNGNAG